MASKFEPHHHDRQTDRDVVLNTSRVCFALIDHSKCCICIYPYVNPINCFAKSVQGSKYNMQDVCPEDPVVVTH